MTKNLSPSRHRLNDLQVIESYYFDDANVQLNDQQTLVKDILREIRSLELSDNYSPTEVVHFLKQDYGIAESTAWKYRTYCHRLFGRLEAADKNFEKAKWRKRSEMLWQQANEQYEDGEYKMKTTERAKFIKESKDIANLVNGFDKDDSDAPDWDKIAPPPVLLVLSDKTRQFLQEVAKGGVVDWSNFMQAETIDYEPSE